MKSDLPDRRSLLGGAAVAAATATTVTSVKAQGVVRLRAASAWPRARSGPGAVADQMAARVATLTDARLQIEIVDWRDDALSLYRAASNGDVDICFGSEDMWLSLNPAYGLFFFLPGGLTAGEFEAWIAWGGGHEVWDALAEQSGLAPYQVGDTGLSHTLANSAFGAGDLPRLTVAADGLAANVWRTAGAGRVVSGAEAAASDVYNGASAVNVMLTAPGAFAGRYETMVNRVNNAISMNVNRGALSRLSDADRKVIQLAANAVHTEQRADALQKSMAASAPGGAMAAVAPMPTSPELLASLLFASSAVLEEVGSHDRIASDAVWSFQLFSEDAAAWSAIGEGAFLEARARNHGGQR